MASDDAAQPLFQGVLARLGAALAIGAAILTVFHLAPIRSLPEQDGGYGPGETRLAQLAPTRHAAPPSSETVAAPPPPPPPNPRRLAASKAPEGAPASAPGAGAGGLHVTAFAGPGAAAASGPVATGAARSSDPLPLAPLSGVASFALIDLSTGALLSSLQAQTPLMPASVAKIPTAVYALDVFGPDHRFETRVLLDGGLRDGVVRGDLILQGGGDPELDTGALGDLVDLVVAAGVRRVDGRFLYDPGPIPEIAAIAPDQPAQARYNPGVSGLNLNFNRVLLRWTPRKGAAPMFEALVDHQAMAAPNVTVLAAPDAQKPTYRFGLLDMPGAAGGRGVVEAWSVKTAPFRRSGRRWLPVRRPGQHAAEAFRGLAALAGASLPPPEPGVAPDYSAVLAQVSSPPLSPILRDMLKYSTNLTAEVVGVAATHARGGGGSVDDLLARSGAAMSDWLGAQMPAPQPPQAAMLFANHSGLATRSRLSAGATADMLAAIARRSGAALDFAALTPRYRKAKLGKRATVRAKTGTMYFGRGLAGYLTCASGRRMAFAYFNSDFEARERFDALMRDRHVTSTPEARRWLSRARAIERALLADWTDRFCA